MPDIEERITSVERFISELGPMLGWVYEAMRTPPGGGGAAGGGGKGGGKGAAQPIGPVVPLPGEALEHCQWVQIWSNGTGKAADRSVTAKPASPPNGFPPGSTITVFVGPVPATKDKNGNNPWPPPPPPAGQGAPVGSWPTIPQNGGGAGVNVPAGDAVYVHYDKGTSTIGGVRAVIT